MPQSLAESNKTTKD